jgi:hypothetical protein
MQETGILASWLLFYASPFLIFGVWLVRLRQTPESPRWRWAMSWVSLSLATAAVGAWLGTFTRAPHDIGESLYRMRHGVATTCTFLYCALAAALVAKGKGRVWTVASALVIPFWWLIAFHSWI